MTHSAEALASQAELRRRLRRPSLLAGIVFSYAFGALSLWNTLGCGGLPTTLTVVINGPGMLVSCEPDVGEGCGAEPGDRATNPFIACVTVEPAEDFVSWGTDCGGCGNDMGCDAPNQCSVFVDDGIQSVCTANFCETADLEVTVQGTGSIVADPGSLDCGANQTCTASYCSGTDGIGPENVALMAVEGVGSGFFFDSFGGDPDCLDGMVTTDQDLSCIALFRQPELDVTVTGDGRVIAPSITNCREGSPAVDCSQPVAAGQTLTLTALPDPGASFSAWGGDCPDGASTSQLLVEMDASCTASFGGMSLGSGAIGVIEIVSLADDESLGNASSGDAAIGAPSRMRTRAISADAAIAVFYTDFATNLTPEASPGLHLRDRPAGETLQVTPLPIGGTRETDLSADGRFVAYGFDGDVSVLDRESGVTQLVSVAEGDVLAGGSEPALSGNGRYVAYSGQADPGGFAVLVRDTCAGATPQESCTPSTTIVSVDDDGTQLGDALTPLISADGRRVIFVANAAESPGFQTMPHLHDRDADGNGVFDEPGGISTILATPDPGGGLLDNFVEAFAIDASGRYIAFDHFDSDLNPFGSGSALRDTCAGAPAGCVPSYLNLSVRQDGSPSPSVNISDLSANGRFAALSTFDPLLVGDDEFAFAGNVGVVRDTCVGAPLGCTPENHEVTVETGGDRGAFPNNGYIRLSDDGALGIFVGPRTLFDLGDMTNFNDVLLTLTGFRPDPGAVPTITARSPTTAAAGSAGFLLTIAGTGFVPGAVVLWQGSPRPTIFVSPEKLQARLTDADLALPDNPTFQVANPGGTSTPVLFLVN